MKGLFVLVTLITLSCGKEGRSPEKRSVTSLITSKNIADLRHKKQILSKEISIFQTELEQINKAINDLDTSSYGLPPVSLYKIKNTIFRHYIEVQGVVDTDHNVTLSADIYGNIIKINYKPGDFVKKGAKILTIDDNGLSAQVQQAKTKRDLAKTIFERHERLWEQNIGSEIKYLKAKSDFNTSQKFLERMQRQLENTVIKAPFSGYLDDIIVDEGTFVNIGTPLMRIVSIDGMEVKAFLPDTYLKSVKSGNSVMLEFPALKRKTASTIRYTSRFINPDNSSFVIWVPVPEDIEGIRPNLSSKVLINDYTNPKAIVLPQSIILENYEGQHYVYAVHNMKGDKAQSKKLFVELGMKQGDDVEVLSPLIEGMLLISEGVKNVKGESQKVLVVNGSER